LRIGVNIRRKGKIEKAMKCAERITNTQKEARMVLKKVQKEMK